jgi:hypothetical protein
LVFVFERWQIRGIEMLWTGEIQMNAAAISLASLALAGALSATAVAAPAPFASDVDYLRASRCRGIAEGVGADGAALAAYLKGQESGRAAYIVQRGEDERVHAKRQAKGFAKAQLEAELSGACQAFAPGRSAATRPDAAPKG